MDRDFTCSLEMLREKNRVRFSKNQRIYLKIKRFLDIILALLGMVLLLPVFLLVALAIHVEDPKGSIFYTQNRVGRGGTLFKLYKFRSMRSDSPELSTSQFQNAADYITKVGAFLRKSSIDELPQLYNVLKGDMSLIGPRPLLPLEERVHFLRYYYGLYQVRPGLTGLAQIHGRDDMEDMVKVWWDRKYVREISPMQDLRILFTTAAKVLKREGVVDKGEKAEEAVVTAEDDLREAALYCDQAE